MELIGAKLKNFYKIGTLVTNNDSSSQKYFSLKVPHYQRPFSWEGDLVSKLVTDWFKHKNKIGDHRLNLEEIESDSTNRYFAGSIVTVAHKEGTHEYEKLVSHSLVDGQQRYTVLFLTNFVNFSILRLLVRMSIVERKEAKSAQYIERLQKSLKFLFSEQSELYQEFSTSLKSLKKIIIDEGIPEDHSNLLKLLFLPKPIVNSDPKDLYISPIKSLFNSYKREVFLNLSYDLSLYNKSLENILSSYYFIGNESSPFIYGLRNIDIESKDESQSEIKYAKAINSIIDAFESEVKLLYPALSTSDYLEKLHEEISLFLELINVCVIQTNNINDAYTLFEVMNDRSLALNDLDLIKNQFFKEYVHTAEKNKNQLSDIDARQVDKHIEQIIQDCDNQWSEYIFNSNRAGDRKKKLISYLATTYLTHDVSINYKDKESYRSHLSTYLSEYNSYNEESLKRDFNIFQTCSILVEEANIPFSSKNRVAYSTEADINASQFKKTVQLLNALQLEGVLSGLINFVLRSIEHLDSEFSINQAHKFIKLLMLKSFPSKSKFEKIYNTDYESIHTIYEKIQINSSLFWKTTIQSQDYIKPRELSVNVINSHYLMSNFDSWNNFTHMKDLDKDFKNWIISWNYNKSAQTKIKILFLRLLQFDLDDNRDLILRDAKNTLSSDQAETVELDHVIAQNSDAKNYIINKQDINSEQFEMKIHSLGNMMLLTKLKNRQKLNKPVSEVVDIYNGMINIKGQFVGKNLDAFSNRLHELFQEYNDLRREHSLLLSNTEEPQPSDEYFLKSSKSQLLLDEKLKEIIDQIDNRSEFLVNYFLKAINYEQT